MNCSKRKGGEELPKKGDVNICIYSVCVTEFFDSLHSVIIPYSMTIIHNFDIKYVSVCTYTHIERYLYFTLAQSRL